MHKPDFGKSGQNRLCKALYAMKKDSICGLFLYLLEKEWPDWKGKAQIIGDSFKLKIPCPNDPNLDLEIEADEEEITVFFDYYHCHWDGMFFGSVEEEIADVLGFIRNLVNNKIAVVSWFRESKWCGSNWFYDGSMFETEFSYDAIRVKRWK